MEHVKLVERRKKPALGIHERKQRWGQGWPHVNGGVLEVDNTVSCFEYSAQTAEAPYRPVGLPIDLGADPKRDKSLGEFLGVIADPAV